MHTARSLTISRGILCMPPPPLQPCMPPTTTHPLWQPCMPPWQPHMPLATRHAPSNHACPLATMHAPWQPHMPPSNHAHTPATTHTPHNHAWPPPPTTMHTPLPRQPCTPPPCGQTDNCINITFANFVCGR